MGTQLFGVAFVVLASCATGAARESLRNTTAEARRALAVLRPGVALDDVGVGLASDRLSMGALIAKAKRDPWYLDLEKILARQGSGLVRLGILSDSTLERIGTDFGKVDPTMADADGIAFPASGKIFVDPDSADSVEVVAHELAHVVSYRKGYEQRLRPRITLKAADALDPDWVDLDALICIWALSEAEAQFTALACVEQLDGGQKAVAALWNRKFDVDLARSGTAITGPATIDTPSAGRVTVKAGESFRLPPASLTDALVYLAYEGSLATVRAHHEKGATLEATLARTWGRTALTTRELLFPDAERRASAFAGAARAKDADLSAVGAFRVGAALLAWALVQRGGQKWPEANAWGAKLEDDLCLRMKDRVLVWITRWPDEKSAADFARLYAKVAPGALARVKKRRAVFVLGEVEGIDALVSAIDK